MRKLMMAALLLLPVMVNPVAAGEGDAGEKLPLLVEQREVASRSLADIAAEMHSLNRQVGSYPPRFTEESGRMQVYRQWLDLVADAEAHRRQAPLQSRPYEILAELYRQGFNMDVENSARRAIVQLDSCFQRDPASSACHRSAMHFYLSIAPYRIEELQQSLEFLRQEADSSPDPAVEAGWAWLHLYQGDTTALKRQLNYFLERFPDEPEAAEFRKMRQRIRDSVGYRRED